MNTWRIRAHGMFEAVAQEPPCPLKPTLRICLPRPPRRINRYIQLALIGAHRCMAQLDASWPGDMPLYMASEQGSVAEAVALMDEIVIHGRSPMPMPFINVSSNMVGYYLAASLGLNGRNMNVARQHGAFGAMLELAGLESAVDSTAPATLLLGTVAECVWPLAEHRRRCHLPADMPLVEASYWLVVDRIADDKAGPRLHYSRTHDLNEARAWLAAGERWVLAPQLPTDRQRQLAVSLDEKRTWHAPLCHVGHPDAVTHALFAALETDPVPGLHAVAGDPSGGYQLMGVY